MEKVIRDGKVAVLISSGHGAGWYSWNDAEVLLFHPKLVEMVEEGKSIEITQDWVKENLGIEGLYCGGAENLEIHWVSVGDSFRVDEYDGHESLVFICDLNITA